MGLKVWFSRSASRLAATFTIALVLVGCSKGSGGSGGSAATPSAGASSPSGSSTMAATSQYDAGPRAGEQPIDESKVKQGEALFQSKGCSACHGFGRRISCPDLDGVTMRRTAQWMEQQILHPEVMTKQDPIAHQLFAQYSLQMPNQGVKPEEAQALIEFLKHKNHEAAEHGHK